METRRLTIATPNLIKLLLKMAIMAMMIIIVAVLYKVLKRDMCALCLKTKLSKAIFILVDNMFFPPLG